jgi:hypothetical protein
MGNPRFQNRMGTMTETVTKGKEFLQSAVDTIGRTADSEVLVRSVDAVYQGRAPGKGNAAAWEPIAKDMLADADAGTTARIMELTTLDQAGATALAARLKAIQPVATALDPVASRLLQASRILARAQKKGQNLFDMKQIGLELGARAWGDNKSILPDLTSPFVPKTSSINRAILSGINTISNKSVREFASVMLQPVERKGPQTADIGNNFANGNQVFYAALTAFGDVRVALEKSSEWVRNPNPKRRIEIGKEISQALNSRFDFRTKRGLGDAKESAPGVDPRTGKKLADETVAIPSYLRYTADFGPQGRAQLAPYNLENLMGARKVVTKYLTNPLVRAPLRGITPLSNFARHWTVALGPLLGVKHAVADTSRTFLTDPLAVINGRGETRGFEERLLTVSPEISKQARLQREVNEASLAHYYGDHTDVGETFKSDRIYTADKHGNLTATNLESGAEALRRIANDPVFRAWKNRGEEGVRTWLKSAEGHAFMDRSGIFAKFKENGGEADFLMGVYTHPATGKPVATLYEALTEHYLQAYVRPLFGGLHGVAPRITDGLFAMVDGKRPATAAEVKVLLNEVNNTPDAAGVTGIRENPYLSVTTPESAPAYQPLIKLWMTPNRINRNLVFNRLFNKVFDDALKGGATPDKAATIAMDIARMASERIHFDLSQALNVEAKYRSLAWFATKKRLYDTYLLRMMFRSPSVAGGAKTFMAYLEQQNDDPSIPEYDKGKIIINLDKLPGASRMLGMILGSSEGNTLRLDPRTIFWLFESNVESAAGQIVESTAAYGASQIPGMPTLPPTMSDYGISSGRWDGIIGSVGVSIPIWIQASKPEGLTDEWLRDYLDGKAEGFSSQVGEFAGASMGKGAMRALRTSIDAQGAMAMADGVKLSPSEAAFNASLYGPAYQLLQMGRFWPGSIGIGTNKKLSALVQEFTESTPEERLTMIDEHPEIRYGFGVYSTNPVDQYAIVQGFQRNAVIKKEEATALWNATQSGQIYDPAFVKGIYDKYDDMRDQVTNKDWMDANGDPSPYRNDIFAAFVAGLDTGDKSFSEIMRYMFPLADPRVVNRDGYIPTDHQQAVQKAALVAQYEAAVTELKIPNNSSDPKLKWLFNDMVTTQMAKFTKYQDPEGWLTSLERSVADELAQGPGGPNARTKYLTQLHQQHLMAELAGGTNSTAKSGVAGLPMFATMTTEDKLLVGFNSTKAVENIWRQYCDLKSQQTVYMDQNGIDDGSAAGKAMAADLKAWAEQQATVNRDFAGEWEYSKLPIEKRLTLLKIQEGNTNTSEAWGEFLGLVFAYKEDLEKVPNPALGKGGMGVGPSAQKAYDVQAQYWPGLKYLKDKYPEWWNQLIEVFGGPSKFGFVHWKPPEGQFNDLFLGYEDPNAYDFTAGGQ